MADKKSDAADKAALQKELEYAQNCRDNTPDAAARRHWDAVVRSCQASLDA